MEFLWMREMRGLIVFVSLMAFGLMASPAFAQTPAPTSTPRPDQSIPFSGVPVGAIVPYSGFIIPDGWLMCDGSDVSRADFPELYATFQSMYGAGDGVTTFGLPDCSGRTLVGTGTADQVVLREIGQTYGANYYQLTEAEMPVHQHGLSNYSIWRRSPSSGTYSQLGSGNGATLWTAITGFAGGDQPFPVSQPSLVVYFLIWSGTGVGAIGGGGMEQGTPVPEVMVYSTVVHGEATQPVGFAYTVDAGQIGIMILLFAIFVVLMLRVVTDLIGWRRGN
jgi:microcystin-dependent protein